MKLLDRLEATADAEDSYFRAYLLREDIARLRQLLKISESAPDLTTFVKEGSKIGWTPGDMRTWELQHVLVPLLEVFYATALGRPEGSPERLDAAWDVFDATRIDVLVGCLSRVPKPDNE